MISFQHISPPLRVFSGTDSLQQIGRELERIGSKRAVILSGPWAEGPLLDAVRAGAGERCAGVYLGVVAHSPVASVQDAAVALNRLEADAVIALGGGSSIVTARAATILAAEGGDPRSLCTTRDSEGNLRSPKLLAKKLPQLIVPTTPTTAIVKAGSALFDPESGERLALFDPKTRAHAVFIDAQMLESSPRELVIAASINTFSMAIEGLSSRSGDPLSDSQLMHVLRLVSQNLPLLQSADDPDVRANLQMAAVLCGQGTDHTGAGITTVLGHAIGARHHLDNGIANAIVLPHMLRFNGAANEAGLQKIAAALELPRAQADALVSLVVDAVEAMLNQLPIPHRLRDVGISSPQLHDIAKQGLNDWFLRGNPRRVRSEDELFNVLERAF